jgi:hypothetical protein
MTAPKTPPANHNGGPPLSDPPPADGRCKHCRHWKAPPEQEQQAYERFSLGLARRRVRLPTGSCDRVSVGSHKLPAFAATSADFGCGNFEARPVPPRPAGGGYVKVSEDGRIVWEGPEEELPARSGQLGLGL